MLVVLVGACGRLRNQIKSNEQQETVQQCDPCQTHFTLPHFHCTESPLPSLTQSFHHELLFKGWRRGTRTWGSEMHHHPPWLSLYLRAQYIYLSLSAQQSPIPLNAESLTWPSLSLSAMARIPSQMHIINSWVSLFFSEPGVHPRSLQIFWGLPIEIHYLTPRCDIQRGGGGKSATPPGTEGGAL